MKLSWIQRHALLVLLRRESARVKDLCPDDVAANLFSYHLDGLVTARIIEKSARGVYRLTTKGQKLAGTFSTLTERVSENIKTVVMLYGKRDDKYLLFRWSRQPYLGKVTLLYDRMPLGKNLEDGIASALHDKLGDEALPVTFLTSTLVKIMHDDELISHMNALIYTVELPSGFIGYTSRNGEAFMVTVDEPNAMDGVAEFLASVEEGRPPRGYTWRY